VGSKENVSWLWIALDRETREVVGVAIGDRSSETARQLWASLPPDYRQCAVCLTDFWQSYAAILPSKRHKAGGKETGQTNHVERFNNTLRQGVSRLSRKTLSFSKKLDNHIGAIFDFLHHYNASSPCRR
jgi:insertion element IS1 protein InsB